MVASCCGVDGVALREGAGWAATDAAQSVRETDSAMSVRDMNASDKACIVAVSRTSRSAALVRVNRLKFRGSRRFDHWGCGAFAKRSWSGRDRWPLLRAEQL